MPLFDFKCESCDEVFETIAKRDEIPECPKCGNKETQKQISAGSFSLQGGGWASDGYSKGNR